MSISFYGSGQTILQVVSATSSVIGCSTTSSWYNTGIGVYGPIITPTSASSKILVLVSLQGVYNTNAGGGVILGLDRNQSTSVVDPQLANFSGSANLINPWSIAYLDSPATTSPTYYNIVMGVWRSGTAYIEYSVGVTSPPYPYSTITLIEISGA
jgi:hypothetical protein